FQAEDGIRDRNVTGVQTCALPIWAAGFTAVTSHSSSRTTITEPGAPVKARVAGLGAVVFGDVELSCVPARGVVLMVTRRFLALRSEERRVGGGDGWRGWGDE